jgi:capsular polysaccharide export protein
MHYSPSKKLIQNTQNFLTLHYASFFNTSYTHSDTFYGWGRKASGINAVNMAKKYHANSILLEDGFIRSLGLKKSETFSLVEDDVGIYYDANTASRLENILNNYDFISDTKLMQTSKKAMKLIQKHHISKYNNSPDIESSFFQNTEQTNVLVVLQTQGDSSLKYGWGEVYENHQMINDAITQNPHASIYIKLHPAVITSKKKSSISIKDIPSSCIIIDKDINPISILKYFSKVYTQSSGMGMEALILGISVICYAMPYYAGWGLTQDMQKCSRRKRVLKIEALFAGAYILYSKYYNPYREKSSDILDILETIIRYKQREEIYSKRQYLFGFSWWKRRFIKAFFMNTLAKDIYFVSSLQRALALGLSHEDSIYIWGKKAFHELEAYADEKNIALNRVEDGFIRSVPLGSDLTKPYSLVFDSRGIYFDPQIQSDLEYLLAHTLYTDTVLERSRALQKYLLTHKISKYNSEKESIPALKYHQTKQKVILVVGQVEDDASLIYASNGMTNLSLLKKVRQANKEAYILYKPHPDVVVGNRIGVLSLKKSNVYCDEVLENISVDAVLSLSDEVHTMTSLLGFEALMRGKTVYTYGLPFYAGWGLTIDREKCERRTRTLSLDALVASTLIDYPRYIHPKSNQRCEIEVLLEEIQKKKYRYNHNKYYRTFKHIRNFMFRKLRF